MNLSMNHLSVAAGVPPAVEGGVSPPGIPFGSRPVSRSNSNRALPMQAVAKAETGPLTPALSRREREARNSRLNTPQPHRCELSFLRVLPLLAAVVV